MSKHNESMSKCYAAQSKRLCPGTGLRGETEVEAEHKQPPIQMQLQSRLCAQVPTELIVLFLGPASLLRLASTCHMIEQELHKEWLDFYGSDLTLPYRKVQQTVYRFEKRWIVVGLNVANVRAGLGSMQMLPHTLLRLQIAFSERGYVSVQRQFEELTHHCQSLQTLNLISADTLSDLTPILRCPQLAALTVQGNDTFGDVSVLGCCASLRSLRLEYCGSLADVSCLGNCPFLDTLYIENCMALTTLDGMGACAALHTLSLSGCRNLSSLASLAGCVNLRTLDLSDMQDLVDVELEVLGNFDLHTLLLDDNEWLTSLEGLATCTGLEIVCVGACFYLTSFTGLGGCLGLHTLNADAAWSLTDLTGLRTCTSLRILVIPECPQLLTLNGLQDCRDLYSLDISNCSGLTSIDALHNCLALHDIDLRYCEKLTDVTLLNHCMQLGVVYTSQGGIYNGRLGDSITPRDGLLIHREIRDTPSQARLRAMS
jgi:hypothetical protein